MQQTLKTDVKLLGIGLHSGRPARLCIKPGPAGHGIVFRRVDIRDRCADIKARFDNVTDTRLNTTIENADGAVVSTIEHLMAALAGCGIHNALIEIDGPEVPIFDGSSHPFVRALLAAGIAETPAELTVLRVAKPIQVTRGDAMAELVPFDGFEIDYAIAFADAAIGEQALCLDLQNGAFLRELSDCRTFCRQDDVAMMQQSGLALGGTYENAVVVDGARVLSPGGFRRDFECVRHKMLDALGDLALAGAPILRRYRAVREGHALTNVLLQTAMAEPNTLIQISADANYTTHLPKIHLTHQNFTTII